MGFGPNKENETNLDKHIGWQGWVGEKHLLNNSTSLELIWKGQLKEGELNNTRYGTHNGDYQRLSGKAQIQQLQRNTKS